MTNTLDVTREYDVSMLDYMYSARLDEWRITVATFAGARGAALCDDKKYVAMVIEERDDHGLIADHMASSFEYRAGHRPPQSIVDTLAEMMGMPRE